MENKKLIKILLKDMGELEELIAEVKASRQFDTLEMEFIHTRVKGILQAVQLLDAKEETVQAEIKKEPEVSEEPQEKTDAGEPFKEITENEDDVVLEEENEIADAVSRLGDSFLKGKSLNDLITDQNKLEFKLSNRPVSSIQAAIGINDRFQYIRELFDGDNQKFLETVKTLDSKQNIKEAVDYLRNNFKWKKNETSLKFVNLVKRRFING
jgi:hypothetical protein